MSYTLEWTDDSSKDYNNLDGSQKVFIDKALARIKAIGMEAGKPLSGELSGCNKLKHKKLGLRVVFRESKNGIQIIQIVAIGKRADSEVYNISKRSIAKISNPMNDKVAILDSLVGIADGVNLTAKDARAMRLAHK